VKALAQLVHLIHHRGRIAGVATINLDRDGATFAIGHQAIDDDGQSSLAVAIMPILRQRTAAAFVITAADVIEHQAALAEVALGEFFLDARLSF
jgi:hypothetical protein